MSYESGFPNPGGMPQDPMGGSPMGGSPMGGSPMGGSPAGPPPDNNMIWAIVSLFCCLPMAIVAIINASKVNDLYHQGNYQGAVEASEKAKKFALIGIGVSIASYVLGFIFLFIIGASASA